MLKRTQRANGTSVQLEYDDGHVVANVTIVRGSFLHGLTRDGETAKIFKIKTEDPNYFDTSLFFAAALTMYPAFVAAVSGAIAVDGAELPWPPDVKTVMLELPDELVTEIMADVFTLNGHWTPRDEKKPLDAEKK